MKAIRVVGERLVWTDTDAPAGEPGPGHVRIAIRASAVNRADLLQRVGGYPPPPGASDILGLECAGVVEAVGDGVARVDVGDSVCALLAGGGYAEAVVVPAGQVLKVPRGLSFAEAASLPEVFATAYLNLYMEARLRLRETVLLHAGGSGVGTAAIQLCRESGNPCYVTAGSESKVARCVELGAAGGCDRHAASFAEQVREWTAGEGVDVILDPVGGAYLADNLASLKLEGRLVVIGLLGGARAELPLAAVLTRRLSVIGSTLRSRNIARKAAVMDALRDRVWPKIEAGAIRPVIDTVFPMDRAEEAHSLVAGNETFGKVVLEVP